MNQLNITVCRFTRNLLLIVFAYIAVTQSGHAETSVSKPKSIEVFTIAKIPVAYLDDVKQQTGIVAIPVHDVGGIADIEAELKSIINREGYPVNENIAVAIAQAETLARERLKAAFQDGEIQKRGNIAMGSLAKAYGFQLSKLPAVVFDQQSVVYGVTDLRDALALYRKWKSDKR